MPRIFHRLNEASRARSDAEFISKLNGAAQEADESILWLELLREECGVGSELTKPLEAESSELIAIFTTMVLRTEERVENRTEMISAFRFQLSAFSDRPISAFRNFSMSAFQRFSFLPGITGASPVPLGDPPNGRLPNSFRRDAENGRRDARAPRTFGFERFSFQLSAF